MRFGWLLISVALIAALFTGVMLSESSDAYIDATFLGGLEFNESSGESSAESINDAAKLSVCHYENGVLTFTESCYLIFLVYDRPYNAMTFDSTENGINVESGCTVAIYYHYKSSLEPDQRYSVINADCDDFNITGKGCLQIRCSITDSKIADNINGLCCRNDLCIKEADLVIRKNTSDDSSFGYGIFMKGTELKFIGADVRISTDIHDVHVESTSFCHMEWDGCDLLLSANNACFNFANGYKLSKDNINEYRYSSDPSGADIKSGTIGTKLTTSRLISTDGTYKASSSGIDANSLFVVIVFFAIWASGFFGLPLLDKYTDKKLRKRAAAIQMNGVDENLFRLMDEKYTDNDLPHPPVQVRVVSGVSGRRAIFEMRCDGVTCGEITRTLKVIDIPKGEHRITIHDYRKPYDAIFDRSMYITGKEQFTVFADGDDFYVDVEDENGNYI